MEIHRKKNLKATDYPSYRCLRPIYSQTCQQTLKLAELMTFHHLLDASRESTALQSDTFMFCAAHKLASVRDAGDAVSLLQGLAAGTFDSSELVLTACGADVESSAIEARAAVHRPQVRLRLCSGGKDNL